MSTAQTLKIESTSSTETEQIGELLGKNARGGEVIELSSDLGGGKTTLVRGLARGMGSTDVVASPSFTISRVYSVPDKPNLLYHFDFYRLHDAGLLGHELRDVLADKTNTVVVEWGDIVDSVLPKKRLEVRIRKTGQDSRELVVNYPEQLSYMVEGVL